MTRTTTVMKTMMIVWMRLTAIIKIVILMTKEKNTKMQIKKFHVIHKKYVIV